MSDKNIGINIFDSDGNLKLYNEENYYSDDFYEYDIFEFPDYYSDVFSRFIERKGTVISYDDDWSMYHANPRFFIEGNGTFSLNDDDFVSYHWMFPDSGTRNYK